MNNNTLLLLIIAGYLIMQMCKSQKREQFTTLSSEETSGEVSVPVSGEVPVTEINPSILECENKYNILINKETEKKNVIDKNVNDLMKKSRDIESLVNNYYEMKIQCKNN